MGCSKWPQGRKPQGGSWQLCGGNGRTLTGRPAPQWKGLWHKGVSLLSLGTSKLMLEATGGSLVGEIPIPERGMSI